MRGIALLFVQIAALTVAGPIPEDLLFASEPQDLGNSPYYSDMLSDPVDGGSLLDGNDMFSSSALSSPSDPFYTETLPGDVASADEATLPSEPGSSFDQGSYVVDNNDFFGALDPGGTDGDCIPDLTLGLGKSRMRRSCSNLKEDKQTEGSICRMKPTKLSCCSQRGISGVFDLGCQTCMHSHLSFSCLYKLDFFSKARVGRSPHSRAFIGPMAFSPP